MRIALLALALSLSLSLSTACGGEAPRTDGAKKADAKKADAKKAVAKAGDTKAGDTKLADAKAGDTKTADAKIPTDAEAGDVKAGDAEPKPEAPAGNARTWTFDEDAAGKAPTGIRLTEAAGTGTPATWAVVAEPTAPSQPNAFGITESKNTKATYNIAIVEGTSHGDVDLQVAIKARTGALNQGGGVIWRFKDVDNYYIARWDPIEDNAYIYIVQGGVRTALAKLDIELDTESWHTLRVVAEGPRIELFIDDEPKLTAENAELEDPGMIGLWTKSDAASLFDDLSVATP
jgi:hypothetical protein